MRARIFLAIIGATAWLVTGCTDGSDDVEIDAPEDPPANSSANEGAPDSDETDGTPSETDVADLPSTTIQTPTLDGRTLTITAPDGVIRSEPSTMGLRFATDTFALTVEVADPVSGDIPEDHEVEVEEDRWDGQIRIVSTPEGMPFAGYDDGDTSLFIFAEEGPSLELVASTEELMDALDRIDIEQTDDGPVVTATDPDLERGLSLAYELDGIDAALDIVEDDEIVALLPIEPVEGPIAGAGGEVVVGENGIIELTGDGLVARIQLILPDDDEYQRGLDLMTLLELELDD